ncbi:lamin tail domain-containing protein [Haloplanus halophilus]|uniref:lamin tail domain-containing protein n=1 Tax=Haloplanus halophilus TaxID=2949993 RepID=UPI00203EC868|nr:lamin tail domain-containing protein [Haloplanus sp. GDY1]
MLPLAAVALGLALVLAGGAYALASVDAVDHRAALVGAVALLAVGGVLAGAGPVGSDARTADGATAVGDRSPATAAATGDAERAATRTAAATDATTDAANDTVTATVVGASAGDWLTYRTAAGARRTVRLAGVDAPGVDGDDPRQFDGVLTGSRGRTCLADHGRRALVSLRTDLVGTSVTVDPVERADGVDAAVVTVDGQSINRRMVDRGHARARGGRYADAERAARSADRGLWSCSVVAPDRPLRESNVPNVRIAAVHPNPPGDDGASLTEEYVVIENTGPETVDLSNWYLVDGDGHTYFFFDGRELRPGTELVLHVGAGRDREGHVYWGASTPVLDNDHESLKLVDGDADRVVRFSY